MIKTIFTGNVAGEVRTATTKTGKQVANFDVGVKGATWLNTFAGKDAAKEEQLFIRVTAWGKLGQTCAQFLTKGRFVAVSGNGMKLNVYKSPKFGDARVAAEITADEVEFGSRGPGAVTADGGDAEPQAEKPAKGQQDSGYVPEGFVEVSEADLPF